MRIVPETDIADCCDLEATRYAINSVLVVPQDAVRAYLVATDSRALVISECAYDNGDAAPDSELVPGNAFPKSKASKKRFVERKGDIYVNGDGRYAAVDKNPGRFPDVAAVIPNVSEKTHIEITIDANLLLLAAKAVTGVGTKRKELTLLINKKESNEPIACIGNDGFAVVMPIEFQAKSKDEKKPNYFSKWKGLCERFVNAVKKS